MAAKIRKSERNNGSNRTRVGEHGTEKTGMKNRSQTSFAGWRETGNTDSLLTKRLSTPEGKLLPQHQSTTRSPGGDWVP